MESIINIGTFIKHLTYYIKITIYINKGTNNDKILERCIKLYNKYKTIEASPEISDENQVFVRKCLKRLNLILKVDPNGKPIDVRNKENQLKIIYLEPHPSLVDDNMNSMIKYATENNITVLTEVPLMFILRESKYRDLLWQYTRSLFYISQLLINSIPEDADFSNITIKHKKQVFDDAAVKLETILVNIAEIEEKLELDKIMTVDNFLNNKLIKTGINEKNVSEARDEVKGIFQKKGLGTNNSLLKMVDSISDKLTNVNLSKGNIIQSMFGIAQNVAQEMKGEIEGNPEKFQSTLGAITDVFKDAMNTDSTNQMPSEVKNMFNSIMDPKTIGTSEPNTNEIMKGLESLVETNGLNREEFFSAIKGNNGDIDVNRLESYLNNKQK